MPPPQGSWNPIEGPGDYTITSQVHSDTYSAISPLSADLVGKSIFVTGASKGVGRAIAISFAQAGASFIALGARSDLRATAEEVVAAAKRAGRKTMPNVVQLSLDVENERSVKAAMDRIAAETGGRLDVVINNAGILEGRGLMAESDPDNWWHVVNVNFKGPYLVARAALPLLLRGDLKAIVTVSSAGAHLLTPKVSAYQTSKLAVVRLMEFIATEYGDQGIVAFSVHPGNILTHLVNNGEGMPDKFKAVFTETPQLCGDSLVFLTKENRAWLNGRYINCTWDLPELTSDPIKAEIIKEDKLKVRLVV